MDWQFRADTSEVVSPADEAARALGGMGDAARASGKAISDSQAGAAGRLGASTAAADRLASASRRASEAARSIGAGLSTAGGAAPGVSRLLGAVSDGGKLATGAGAAARSALDEAVKGIAAAKGATGAAGAAASSAASAGAKAAAGVSKATGAASGGVGALVGNLKGALPLMAAVSGAAGLAGLARMAIGYRAMGQIQALTARTQYGFRMLFAGVDAQPVVRALDRFSRNLTGQTVTGRALGDVLTRSFNGIFRAVEAAEPYVTAFGQGMVIAFLYAENAVLRARVALAPYTGALDGLVSSTSLMRVAAIGGGVALVAMAGYAAVAAAPFLALAAAVLAVAAAFEQASKLAKEWDENSSSQIWRKLKSDLGVGGSQQDKERAQGIVQGDDFDKAQAAKGQAVGKAMGDGMVAGMAASEASVAAAGGKLAKAAEAGAKAAAEIRSPSRKMRREVGRQLGEGVALGEEDMARRVQKAAASSLVPDPDRLPSLGGRGAGGATFTGPLVSIGQLVITGGEDLKEMVLDGIEGAAARAAATLGLTVPARS